MAKIEITAHDLYITNIKSILKGQLNPSSRLLRTNGRHSDAVVYVLSGSCTYYFEDDTFTVHEGDVLYLAHEAVYKMMILENYHFIFCDFYFVCDEQRKSNFYTPKNTLDVKNLFTKLLHSVTYPNKRTFCDRLAYLYDIYGAIRSSVESTYLVSNTKEKPGYIKEKIDTQFADTSLSVSALAEQAGMSEVYFRRLFKAMYGTSPSHYILSVRIENAKALMKYAFLSLEECATQSGFLSLSYFCRVFKTAVGISPAKYRKTQ